MALRYEGGRISPEILSCVWRGIPANRYAPWRTGIPKNDVIIIDLINHTVYSGLYKTGKVYWEWGITLS